MNRVESKVFTYTILTNIAAMTNQQLIDAGRNQMDQTDQAIERSKMVTSLTIHPCPVCHGKIYKTFL